MGNKRYFYCDHDYVLIKFELEVIQRPPIIVDRDMVWTLGKLQSCVLMLGRSSPCTNSLGLNPNAAIG